MTYQIALLSASTCEDEDGLGTAARASGLELIGRAQELTRNEDIDLWFGNGNRSCGSQSGQERGSDKLHVGCWTW